RLRLRDLELGLDEGETALDAIEHALGAVTPGPAPAAHAPTHHARAPAHHLSVPHAPAAFSLASGPTLGQGHSGDGNRRCDSGRQDRQARVFHGDHLAMAVCEPWTSCSEPASAGSLRQTTADHWGSGPSLTRIKGAGGSGPRGL